MRRSLLNPIVMVASTFVFLVSCAGARSQSLTVSDVGGRVRVKADGADKGWIVGKLRELPGDSVRLWTGVHPRDSLSVATHSLPSLVSFERSRGKRSQSSQGAWIGLSAGVVAGLIVGAATYEECSGCLAPDPGTAGSAILGGVLFGLAGLGLGALIGSQIDAEHWEPIPRPWAPGERADDEPKRWEPLIAP